MFCVDPVRCAKVKSSAVLLPVYVCILVIKLTGGSRLQIAVKLNRMLHVETGF